MKTLLLSDIHANIYALEAIWARERDCERIYCAGDLVDYGFFPRQTLDWVREHNVVCVQGNHDRWVSEIYRSGVEFDALPISERTWAHFNASLLGEEEIEFLDALPIALTIEIDDERYGITHMYREYQEIVSLHAFDQFRKTMYVGFTKDASGDQKLNRMIFGHTHRQSIRCLSDDWQWLNPGSASYRRKDDPDQTAHYMVFTDGRISLRRVAYNLEPVYRAGRGVLVNESEAGQAELYFGRR